MILRGSPRPPTPTGNRIDLTWSYPSPGPRPAVRVVRREGGHPTGPDDGVLVVDEPGRVAVSDTGLRGETVYYYGLFPHTGTPPVYDVDPHNRASATALSPYDFAELLYGLLPSIYRRYDAVRLPAPGSVPSGDGDKGQLRRFLDLPGGELDQLYSLARTLLGAADLDRVDGRAAAAARRTGSAGGPTSGCRSPRSAPRSGTPRRSTGPWVRSTR